MFTILLNKEIRITTNLQKHSSSIRTDVVSVEESKGLLCSWKVSSVDTGIIDEILRGLGPYSGSCEEREGEEEGEEREGVLVCHLSGGENYRLIQHHMV